MFVSLINKLQQRNILLVHCDLTGASCQTLNT